MKKIISLLLFLITVTAFFCVSSFGYDYDKYEDNSDARYSVMYLTDNTCRIDRIDFKKNNGEVTIPSQIAGRTVTELGDGTNAVLTGSNKSQKLILPNTIQKINDNASKDASEDLCETLIITGNNIQYIGEKSLYRNSTGFKYIVFKDLSFDNAKKLVFAKDFIYDNHTYIYFPDSYADDIYYYNSTYKNNANNNYPKPYSLFTGSTISEGNTWIIAGISVVAIVAIAVIVVKKKKKSQVPVTVEGPVETETKE